MRFALVAFPVPSHFFPMVPLGWALAAAGHEVRVASHPSFLPTVESAGLTGVGVGKEPDLRWVFEPGGVAPLASVAGSSGGEDAAEALRAARGLTMFAQIAADMADELVPWARSWRPDLVVFEPRALAGVIAAAAVGVPAVRHLWGVDYTRGRWNLERQILGPTLERFAVGPADWHGALSLDPCPREMQVGTAGGHLPIRFIPYNGAGRPPDWLAHPGSRPRVCVTWGTTLARQSGQIEPAKRAVRAAAALGAEVVIATTPAQAALFGDLPDGVRIMESTPPLHRVLPHCAAVVHPGGSGTLMTAIAAGLPQVVVPAVADQFLNAERFAVTGAGRAVLEGPESGPDLSEALAAVLDDESVTAHARRLAAQVAEAPAPADVVGELTALAGARS
jgi:hypothetical protein